MGLERMIDRLEKDLDLEGALKTNAPGVYALKLEEDMVVLINEITGGFAFSTTLAPCPKQNNEDFFLQALLANLLGQGTGGAVLGLNESGETLKLVLEVEYEVDYRIFSELLEDFINWADYWRSEALALQPK